VLGPSRRGEPLVRSRGDRVIAGVAGGLGARLGVDPLLVRIALIVLTFAGGSGPVIYVGCWLFVPREGDCYSIAQAAFRDRRHLSQALAVGAIVLGLLLLARRGFGFNAALVLPVALAAGGLVLVWHGADDEEQSTLANALSRLRRHGEHRRVVVLRIVVGVVLVVAGVFAFAGTNGTFAAIQHGIVATLGIVAGVALIFGPWWLRLARDLTEERRERIRSEERAELAGRVHDSVLQTLALIQRQADDPRAVVSLARRQERELRGWIYGGPQPPADGTLRAAVDRAVREVEEVHGVTVDAVVVGDATLDDALSAMVAAAREAMVNSAKWSGGRTVSLYAEVDGECVSVFVRDRGVGFDPASVGGDHHGIAESIRARMERHGGRVEIRSEPGHGTEVELAMRRTAA
jgi:signal transduction histidine kinase/phage shock protein PspC (stress-responsive transcriptional regulator)